MKNIDLANLLNERAGITDPILKEIPVQKTILFQNDEHLIRLVKEGLCNSHAISKLSL